MGDLAINPFGGHIVQHLALVKTAILSIGINQVDFQYPVPGGSIQVGITQAAGVFRVDMIELLWSRQTRAWKLRNDVPGDVTAELNRAGFVGGSNF